jgi:hypothetical protein
MQKIPIRRTTRDLASIAAPFLVPNGGNTVRALQAAIADAIIRRREAQQREVARWRKVGRGYVRGAASAGR